MRTTLVLLAMLVAPLLVAAPAAADPLGKACDALDCDVEACTPPASTGSGWSRVCVDYPPDKWCPLYVADAQGNFWSCLLPHGVRASDADLGLPPYCQHVFSAPDISYYRVCFDYYDSPCMVYTESGAVWGTQRTCYVGLP